MVITQNIPPNIILSIWEIPKRKSVLVIYEIKLLSCMKLSLKATWLLRLYYSIIKTSTMINQVISLTPVNLGKQSLMSNMPFLQLKTLQKGMSMCDTHFTNFIFTDCRSIWRICLLFLKNKFLQMFMHTTSTVRGKHANSKIISHPVSWIGYQTFSTSIYYIYKATIWNQHCNYIH